MPYSSPTRITTTSTSGRSSGSGGRRRSSCRAGSARSSAGRASATSTSSRSERASRSAPLRVEATFAAHDGSRPPYPARAPAVGYAVLGSRRIYFAGDTDLFPEMDGLVPDLDLALIPIWGWGPSLGRGAHLDPDGAAEARRAPAPEDRRPDPLGDVRPPVHGASHRAEVPRRAAARVQRRGGAAGARRRGARAHPGRGARALSYVAAGGRTRPFAAMYSSSVRRPSDRSFASRSSSST